MTIRGPSVIRSGALAALLALGACAGPGAGMDNVDLVSIRVITPTTATPDCMIGRRTTPLCAVEILIGCSNQIWDWTCGGTNAPYNAYLRRGKDRVEYVIVKSGFANPEKVRAIPEAEWKKHPDLYEFLVKGIFQAHVLERVCSAAGPNCEGVPWEAALYNVGPHGKAPDTWASGYALAYHPSEWFVD